MGATATLPILEPAVRAVCSQVADRLELEAVDLAASMTAAVFDEIPQYGAVAAPGPRQVVFDHSADHVRAVVRAIRTWSLPSGAEPRSHRTAAPATARAVG